MGREALCYAELSDESGEVRALLESHEIRLRGSIRATFELGELRNLVVSGEVFEAQTPCGSLRLHLGSTEARKWLDRVSSLPTLAQKLGLLPGTPVHMVGDIPDIASTLKEAGARIVALSNARLVFILVAEPGDLSSLERLVPCLPSGAHLWVLRHKGKAAKVKESDIMATLRSRGLGPSKTAAWSTTYAADRYGRKRGLGRL